MKKMKKMLTAALCALMVLSGCGASNSTPQESEAEKEIETLCMNALEEQEEWKQYQRSSRSYGTRINWADETEQALAAEEYEETSSSEIYTDDATGLKYSFVYSDYTHSYELTRWNDEAGEDVYNMRFWSEEPSVDQVDLPLPEEGISCYYINERTT